MIMDVETIFCKMHEQFQAVVSKLQKAVEENTPIDQVEETLVEDLRTLGRSAVEAFIERQGDGDIGAVVEHEGRILKRLPEVVCDRYFSAFGPIVVEQRGYATRATQKVDLKPLAVKLALPESGYSYVLQRWDGTKRMACVGGIYTIDRFERSVDDVLDDIRRKQRQSDRPQPQNKRLRANLSREVGGRMLNAKDATFARAVYLNGDWSNFHQYLIRREHKRLYPNRTRLVQSFHSPN